MRLLKRLVDCLCIGRLAGEALDVGNELLARVNAELLVDVAHVRLHRIAREAQFFGEGRPVAAAHAEPEHFSLALRKVVRVAHELGR